MQIHHKLYDSYKLYYCPICNPGAIRQQQCMELAVILAVIRFLVKIPQTHVPVKCPSFYTIPLHSRNPGTFLSIQGEEMVEGYKELEKDCTAMHSHNAILNLHTILPQLGEKKLSKGI